MKRYISYFAVLLAVLLGAACSKDDSVAGSDNRTGVMAMTVSTRQTADTGEYDPLQHQTVYIYNDEDGLLRKYTSKEACPERLELLAGTYRVAVEAGEEVPADFTKRLYKGEEKFTVKPGETTNVTVVCQIVNTVVEVKFDDTIAENLAPRLFRMDRRRGKGRRGSRRSGQRPGAQVHGRRDGLLHPARRHDVAGLALPRNACRG